MLNSIVPGGSGGRIRKDDRNMWELERKIDTNDNDGDDSLYSLSSAPSSEDEVEYDIMEDECITDLKGNRILPVKEIVMAINRSMCCKKCAIAGYHQYLRDFLAFTDEHEERIKREEDEKWFDSRNDRLEWQLSQRKTTRDLYSLFCGMKNEQSAEEMICKEFSVSEETYGFATSIFGLCSKKKNSHVFRIDAEKVVASKNKFHGNTKIKKFAINYKIAAAMEQMGCGTTQIAMLSAFLDLPPSWATVNWHLREIESVLGPVQEAKKQESENDALALEVELAKASDDLELHECTIEGHKHPPLPKIKGSYGM